MSSSHSLLSKQIRDIPDFLPFWDDLFEAQQRFLLVSHGYPENSHRSSTTSIKSALLNDLETWKKNAIPRSAFFKSPVRPAYLTFMQAMPMITNLYHKFHHLSALEMRMLCSQLEVQTDIILSARHNIHQLSYDEQHHMLTSYSFIENIRTQINNINPVNSYQINYPDNKGSRILSRITDFQPESSQMQEHNLKCFNSFKELASLPTDTDHQIMTTQQSYSSIIAQEMTSNHQIKTTHQQSTSIIAHEMTPSDQNETSSNNNLTSNMQDHNPADCNSVRELALNTTAAILSISTRNETKTTSEKSFTSDGSNESSIVDINIHETTKGKDNLVASNKSRIVYLIPRHEHKIIKWSKRPLSKHKFHKRCSTIKSDSSNHRPELSSKITNSTETAIQQQATSPGISSDVDKICHLFLKMTLYANLETLKGKEEGIRTVQTQEIKPISSQLDDIISMVSKVEQKEQQKAKIIFEPTKMSIIVKRIAAHRQLICQTIRGRQRGRKKKSIVDFSSFLAESKIQRLVLHNFHHHLPNYEENSISTAVYPVFRRYLSSTGSRSAEFIKFNFLELIIFYFVDT